MEYDKIKQLMEDMGKSNIEELEIEFPEGMKISMKKNVAVVPAQQVVAQQSTNIPAVQSIQTTQPIQEEPKEEYKEIKSPMVGTFYSKPNESSPAYVNVGDSVNKGDIVCIIEAMKLMNEITSEVDGKIVEILVENEAVVEYDQPLFRIQPN